MDITIELAEKSLAAFQKKIEFLKLMGLDPEMLYLMMAGPEDAKVIMEQIEAMFQSGYYEGYKEAFKSCPNSP